MTKPIRGRKSVLATGAAFSVVSASQDTVKRLGLKNVFPRRNAFTTAGPWLFPVILAVGICYMVFVLVLPINHHPLWKSITYFMQTVPLVASLDNRIMN